MEFEDIFTNASAFHDYFGNNVDFDDDCSSSPTGAGVAVNTSSSSTPIVGQIKEVNVQNPATLLPLPPMSTTINDGNDSIDNNTVDENDTTHIKTSTNDDIITTIPKKQSSTKTTMDHPRDNGRKESPYSFIQFSSSNNCTTATLLREELTTLHKYILTIEHDRLLPRPTEGEQDSSSSSTTTTTNMDDDDIFLLLQNNSQARQLMDIFNMLEDGRYADVLKSDIALSIFGSSSSSIINKLDGANQIVCDDMDSMTDQIKKRVLDQFSSSGDMSSHSDIIKCIMIEILGIASLNLFLQLNYTGPSLDYGIKPELDDEKKMVHDDGHPLDGINPHDMFELMASIHHENMSSTFENSSTSTSLLSSNAIPLPSVSEEDDENANNVSAQQQQQQPSSSSQEMTAIRLLKETNTTNYFHNAVLSELAIDGEWPFQTCIAPYFLLLARSILSMLTHPDCPFKSWSSSSDDVTTTSDMVASSMGINMINGASLVASAKHLSCVALWNARAIVAHRRLISTRDDDGQCCSTLWNEAESAFSTCLAVFCNDNNNRDDIQDDNITCSNNNNDNDKRRRVHISSSIMLEWGLAQHHFRKSERGKASFMKALEISGLEVEVTGAIGKRTKYQQDATAQYLVRAKPSLQYHNISPPSTKKEVVSSIIEGQMIKHDDVSDDALLLEKIKFDEQADNEHHILSILDQSILLALCLDVKNDNPMDGLTGEQMGAYLARVLNQHDDWMVYATALLERAWLESERTHGRERAILQIQALADQHTNRLTLTQSTFKSVEEDSAPAQDRLRNLHGIVYPPRWEMLRDLAERYAKIGIVTSAAEIFEEIELWDEVVECYRLAGKESRAMITVQARLAERETPRMLAAMGGLTNDPKYYVRALELSRGQFYDAHVALGKLSYDKGDLREALGHFNAGLAIKPLMPAVWFRVGTICMHLGEWDAALRAFTEVVKQEPEEGDAWANVAAIHLRNKNPTEAYPALVEVSQTSTAKCYIFRTILFLMLNPCQIVAETKPQQLEGVGK